MSQANYDKVYIIPNKGTIGVFVISHKSYASLMLMKHGVYGGRAAVVDIDAVLMGGLYNVRMDQITPKFLSQAISLLP